MPLQNDGKIIAYLIRGNLARKIVAIKSYLRRIHGATFILEMNILGLILSTVTGGGSS